MEFQGFQNKYAELVHARRSRVNGALLQGHHNKKVCVIGTVDKHEGGAALKLKTSDNQVINVRFKNPPVEALTGMIEVYGVGQGKNLILAEAYTAFPEEVSSNFDMPGYNDVVNYLNSVSNPWSAE